ncbi:MAG: hypothetical protein PQJ60_04370 [Spirochaetales bacterium]|nr:hypothetical protein [Spirochaetales bacterium]
MKKIILLLFLLLPFSLFGTEGKIRVDSLSVQPVIYKPLGIYSDISSFAAGSVEQLNFTHSYLEDLRFSSRLGVTFNSVESEELSRLLDTSFSLGAGWVFHGGDRFSFVPQFCAGFIVHHVTGDWGVYDESQYNAYLDQYYTFSCELGFNLGSDGESSRWTIIVTPEFSLFPESDNIGFLAGASAGIKWNS